MTLKSRNLIHPSNEVVGKYIGKFNNDERYYLADQAIVHLFTQFPENKRLEDILLKISVINDLYSTQIYATFLMAKHIQRLDIDASLRQGDPEVVTRISLGHEIRSKKTNKEINFYSFGIKYCSWHHKDMFPIYDSFVYKILIAYREKDGFSNFKKTK